MSFIYSWYKNAKPNKAQNKEKTTETKNLLNHLPTIAQTQQNIVQLFFYFTHAKNYCSCPFVPSYNNHLIQGMNRNVYSP